MTSLIPISLAQWVIERQQEAVEAGYSVEFRYLGDRVIASFRNGGYLCFERAFDVAPKTQPDLDS